MVVEDEKKHIPWYEQDKKDYTVPKEKMIGEGKEIAQRHKGIIKEGQKYLRR